ncbi:MAG: hypothetical protein JW908_05640 [Anaerolineales bacterium]|nr:hypothetical protein [Anaerolineales bacterium]
MNTQILEKLDLDYEVIGKGRLPTEPMQIGDWWVVPAHVYNSTIPPEAIGKVFDLINQGVRLRGLLVADDIRKTKPQEKNEHENEANQVGDRIFGIIAGIAGAVGMLALGMIWLLGSVVAYDPMLIAVLEDGRWICIHSWYE